MNLDEDKWRVRAMQEAAREAIGPWIGDMAEWSLFPTLTYDLRRMSAPRLHPPGVAGRRVRESLPVIVSRYKAAADARWYMSQVCRALRRDVEGVFALELHKNGSSHLHGLLAPRGGTQFGDVAKTGGIWFDRHGYCLVKRVDGPKDAREVAAYIAKYMTKDYSDLVFSPGLSRRLQLEQRFGRF